MNQKEKSQPGSVAIKHQWLGRDSSCRNITNAALKDGYISSVADSETKTTSVIYIASGGLKEKRAMRGPVGGSFFLS